MSHTWIQDVSQGFSSEDMGSQQVFRQTLQAMSHPAQWTPVVHDADTPQGVCATSAGIMLALLDAECTVWLSPHLRGQPIAKWLQFHTGCTHIDDPSQADFAWVALGDIWPGLDAFSWGSDAQPQSACTILIDVGCGQRWLQRYGKWTRTTRAHGCDVANTA